MKNKFFLIICGLVLTGTSLTARTGETAGSLNATGYEKLMVQLDKYRIHTDRYKKDNLPPLMGNSESGGLAEVIKAFSPS